MVVSVSIREPVGVPGEMLVRSKPPQIPAGNTRSNLDLGEIMEPAIIDGMPNDVLIVEDDPIIALDFEDTILRFGVKTIRTAGSVARALQMISDRAPDFALLDVDLMREKSFAIAERLDGLKIPFIFVTGYGNDVRFPVEFSGRPRLSKPCSTEALEAVLRRRPGGGVED
jgi:CheY-like chemotaxis protein